MAKRDSEAAMIAEAMIYQYGAAAAAYHAARRADESRAEGNAVDAATWDKVAAEIDAPAKSRK